MIFATALTFLIVGYLMGRWTVKPDEPTEAAKWVRQTFTPTRSYVKKLKPGVYERPTAKQMNRNPNSPESQEEDAMNESLEQVLG